jgi:hypothetical protein
MKDRLPAPRDLGSGRRDAATIETASPGPVHNGHATQRVHDLEAARSINQRLFETSFDLIVIVDQRGNIIRSVLDAAA